VFSDKIGEFVERNTGNELFLFFMKKIDLKGLLMGFFFESRSM